MNEQSIKLWETFDKPKCFYEAITRNNRNITKNDKKGMEILSLGEIFRELASRVTSGVEGNRVECFISKFIGEW